MPRLAPGATRERDKRKGRLAVRLARLSEMAGLGTAYLIMRPRTAAMQIRPTRWDSTLACGLCPRSRPSSALVLAMKRPPFLRDPVERVDHFRGSTYGRSLLPFPG